MKIVNLTPHDLHLFAEDRSIEHGPSVVLPRPADGPARASESSEEVDHIYIDGERFPIVAKTYGSTSGLPDPEDGTMYVVSVIAGHAARASGRTTDDLLLTHDLVRDAEGRIIGCRGFSRV